MAGFKLDIYGLFPDNAYTIWNSNNAPYKNEYRTYECGYLQDLGGETFDL